MCNFFKSLRKSYSSCEVLLVFSSLRGYGGSLVVIVKSVVTGVPYLLRLAVTGTTVPSESVVTGVIAA